MKKIGLVGCGSIARVHVEILLKIPGISLTAFADCDESRAEEFARTYGGRAYVSLEEMLETEKLDVVHICTPHYLHVPMCREALRRQIHVFMEKPPAMSCEQFEELLVAENNSVARVGVCLQNRYNQTTKELERLLEAGALGAVKGGRAFVTWNRAKPYYVESGWRGMKTTEGGGALMNQAVHTLDLLVRFLGKPEWVEASMHNHHLKGVIEVEDTVEAYIRFPSSIACFYATTGYVTDAPVLLELECEYGNVRLEGNRMVCRYGDGKTVETVFDGTGGPGKAYWGDGHGACIRDYYRCLELGQSYSNDLQSVADTFQLMMDIYESAKKREGM